MNQKSEAFKFRFVSDSCFLTWSIIIWIFKTFKLFNEVSKWNFFPITCIYWCCLHSLCFQVVERRKQIEIEEQEIKRKEKELIATVKLPAEAEAYKVQTVAEGMRWVQEEIEWVPKKLTSLTHWCQTIYHYSKQPHNQPLLAGLRPWKLREQMARRLD